MPLSGRFTKARIVKSVVETNWYTHKKAFETVEIILELIKRSLENGADIDFRLRQILPEGKS